MIFSIKRKEIEYSDSSTSLPLSNISAGSIIIPQRCKQRKLSFSKAFRMDTVHDCIRKELQGPVNIQGLHRYLVTMEWVDMFMWRGTDGRSERRKSAGERKERTFHSHPNPLSRYGSSKLHTWWLKNRRAEGTAVSRTKALAPPASSAAQTVKTWGAVRLASTYTYMYTTLH